MILHYKSNLPLQGGCITKLEHFLAAHLLVIGAVGIGVACLQVRLPALLCRLARTRQITTNVLQNIKLQQTPVTGGMKYLFAINHTSGTPTVNTSGLITAIKQCSSDSCWKHLRLTGILLSYFKNKKINCNEKYIF